MKTNGSGIRKNGRGIGDWLQEIARSWVGPATGEGEGAARLPPQGRRSGNGTDSLAPFLAEGRSTRPADLE